MVLNRYGKPFTAQASECYYPNTPNPVTNSRPHHLRKRLIVCCDGTWKSADRGPADYPSNITRLTRALNAVDVQDDGQIIPQIVFYQSGLGTGQETKANMLLAGGLGYGLDDNVRDCYSFLANNYQAAFDNLPADEIFLFGFSRGAYTVRALSGLISTIGILTKKGMDDFANIYTNYKKGPDNFNRYLGDCRRPGQMPFDSQRNVMIKVIGCFETVGALGLPRNDLVDFLRADKSFDFYNTELSPGVENAFHALGLDEYRESFVPTLWYLPGPTSEDVREARQSRRRYIRPRVCLPPSNIIPGTDPNADAPYINLVQCWFPGAHSDVGGGYASHELADLTLAWMIDNTRAYLSFDDSYIEPMCRRSQAATRCLRSSHRHRPSQSDSIGNGEFQVKDAWGLGKIHDSRTGLFNVLPSEARKPGQYDLGVTNEVMHPCVRYRFEKDPVWASDCKALNGFMYQMLEDGTWQWMKKRSEVGEAILPEWNIVEDRGLTEERLAGPKVLDDLYAD